MADNFNQLMPRHGFSVNFELDVTKSTLLRHVTANSELGNENSSGFAHQYAELSTGGSQTVGEWLL